MKVVEIAPFGVVEKFRVYSFCPSFLNYDFGSPNPRSETGDVLT